MEWGRTSIAGLTFVALSLLGQLGQVDSIFLTHGEEFLKKVSRTRNYSIKRVIKKIKKRIARDEKKRHAHDNKACG